jgi:hypothetical protein
LAPNITIPKDGFAYDRNSFAEELLASGSLNLRQTPMKMPSLWVGSA